MNPAVRPKRLAILGSTGSIGTQVLDLVRRLAERGLGVVIISHNLHDVFECADRITVLRLGQQVALFERAATTQQDVVHAITAGALQHVPGMADSAAVEAR